MIRKAELSNYSSSEAISVRDVRGEKRLHAMLTRQAPFLGQMSYGAEGPAFNLLLFVQDFSD